MEKTEDEDDNKSEVNDDSRKTIIGKEKKDYSCLGVGDLGGALVCREASEMREWRLLRSWRYYIRSQLKERRHEQELASGKILTSQENERTPFLEQFIAKKELERKLEAEGYWDVKGKRTSTIDYLTYFDDEDEVFGSEQDATDSECSLDEFLTKETSFHHQAEPEESRHSVSMEGNRKEELNYGRVKFGRHIFLQRQDNEQIDATDNTEPQQAEDMSYTQNNSRMAGNINDPLYESSHLLKERLFAKNSRLQRRQRRHPLDCQCYRCLYDEDIRPGLRPLKHAEGQRYPRKMHMHAMKKQIDYEKTQMIREGLAKDKKILDKRMQERDLHDDDLSNTDEQQTERSNQDVELRAGQDETEVEDTTSYENQYGGSENNVIYERRYHNVGPKEERLLRRQRAYQDGQHWTYGRLDNDLCLRRSDTDLHLRETSSGSLVHDSKLRELLEELYRDKKYLDNLMTGIEKEEEITENEKTVCGLAGTGKESLLGFAKMWKRLGPIPPRPPPPPETWHFRQLHSSRPRLETGSVH